MKYLVLLLLILFSTTSLAVIETYSFEDEVLEKRYHDFVEELRCPKCQNQNLAGSNSPIAKDLRRELHRLLDDGKSDQEVVNYMVSRYGDFILYRPRFNPETALLWLAPGIFLMIGCILMIRVFLRQRVSAEHVDKSTSLDEKEQQALDSLLTSTDGGAKSVGKAKKDNSNA